VVDLRVYGFSSAKKIFVSLSLVAHDHGVLINLLLKKFGQGVKSCSWSRRLWVLLETCASSGEHARASTGSLLPRVGWTCIKYVDYTGDLVVRIFEP
jgi:hypothetical protein